MLECIRYVMSEVHLDAKDVDLHCLAKLPGNLEFDKLGVFLLTARSRLGKIEMALVKDNSLVHLLVALDLHA